MIDFAKMILFVIFFYMISYLLKVQDCSVDNAFAGKCEDQSLYAKHTNKA